MRIETIKEIQEYLADAKKFEIKAFYETPHSTEFLLSFTKDKKPLNATFIIWVNPFSLEKDLDAIPKEKNIKNKIIIKDKQVKIEALNMCVIANFNLEIENSEFIAIHFNIKELEV